MSVKKPTQEEMIEVCDSLGMRLSPDDVAAFIEVMSGPLAAYNALEQIPEQLRL